MDVLEVFFDKTKDPMYVTKKGGKFSQVNQALCALLGYEPLELLEMRAEEILAFPRERRRFVAEVESQGAVSGFKISLLSRTGKELPCLIDAVSLQTPDGSRLGFVGIIKPQRVLPRNPNESLGFELAIHGAHDGLWEWDLKGFEAQYSDRWKAILGYNSSELSNHINEWLDRILPSDLNSVKQWLNDFLQGNQPRPSCFFRMKTKSGEFKWTMARAQGEFNSQGKCIRLGGSLSDLSLPMRMAEQLKVQEEKVAKLSQNQNPDKAQLSQFLSGEMIDLIFNAGEQKIKETAGPGAILQIHLNRVLGAWNKIGTKAFSEFINEVLVDIMDLVYGRSGSVNKILGDTLLVSFGCPLPQEQDLNEALDCVLEIQRYLATYNEVRPDYLKAPLSLSMGLSYGEVFSGTLGSVHRLEFSLLGAPVTRADWLQKTAEKAGVPILVDERVVESAPPGYNFSNFSGAPQGVFVLN